MGPLQVRRLIGSQSPEADQASTAPGSSAVRSLLALQRTAGNAAVSAMLNVQREPAAQPTQNTQERGPRLFPGNGTTAELQAERSRLVRERDHPDALSGGSPERFIAYVMVIDRVDLLLAERATVTPDAGVELMFDGGTLTMSGRSWAAVSGRPGAGGSFDYSPARQRLEGVGPIPAGTYWIDPAQLVDLSDRWFYGLRYEDAWGSHRITIHPFDSSHTLGRGGFFVHGGTSPGSAGCIDLTSGIGSFAKALGAIPPGTKIKLTVRYPDPTSD
jgi:hypothetical protein